ncbi:uncharacterized protein KGF55_004038 [Candida pseudojiufengensis]|uniref:uncharacterized protein n=1 Tax=Candida pseudojiufengensis TaxID=497109 RepID=UPI00222570A0|nr:uncharacterized protein KGF55_004038 [Candida pseudojiufengensis]KAI5961415.1 hypothetical protein KGF55_004038 [Candida pseudojiufengensis]
MSSDSEISYIYVDDEDEDQEVIEIDDEDEDEVIEIEDEEEEEDEHELNDQTSDISFESEEEEDQYNDEDIFDKNTKTSETPSSKIIDDSINVGCNGTLYLPWSLDHFIQTHFLQSLKKLKNVGLNECNDNDLLIMLQFKKWQSDEVLDSFFSNKDKFLQQCGLPLNDSNNKFEKLKDFTCFICCETYNQVETYSLTCDHKYCIDCYYKYIMNEVNNGQLIRCMEPECKLSIPHKDIAHMIAIMEAEHTLIIAEKPIEENPLFISSAREWINQKNNFKWCPATDCKGFTEVVKSTNTTTSSSQEENNQNSIDISKVPIVGCSEHHEFCFECNYENHLPCTCWLVKKWIKKCADDSETAHWIDAHTHQCPKCHTSIEKNGGCNHMTCRKCKHEFCWICSGDWKQHNNNYSCNRFKDERAEDEIRKNKSRQTLERYLHFYKRYSIHESSMKGDQKILKKIDEVTKLYMEDRRSNKNENHLSWNDVQFLPDAMRSLQNGRKTLKWTYCFAFYLNKSNFSQIFETNQDFLNKTVEDLSEIFEKIIAINKPNKVGTILENKIKIINLAELVNQRRKTLIKSAEENLKDGLLSFE